MGKEMKHNRVSMLATMGYITPEITGKFPGYLSPSAELQFADIPNGLAAISKVPAAGWGQIVAYCAFCELSQDQSAGTSAAGGDFGWKLLTSSDPEALKGKLSAEIANGRLAMMAIIGMFFQDGLTGSAWGDWNLYTDSPLRAKGGDGATFNLASQIGATEPLGYWDPCGFCKESDEEEFLKYRGIELKHGRVAMMCIIGFLGQHFWRFPGFEQVPDGVGALTSAPGSTGFACFFLIVGFFELRILADLEKGNAPGNFGDPFKMVDTGLFGGYTDNWRNFEINNGRLAMIGAIGTITANWYTGLDAFEQWSQAKPVAIEFIKTTIWWAA